MADINLYCEFVHYMSSRLLSGDGSGKNTHISLFFVVMKGEYDALQTWPFQKKVICYSYLNVYVMLYHILI